jgi:hypothetical protein
VNPDADTTRIVRAEQFERRVARLCAEGVDPSAAEVWVAFEEPHLAQAWEELQHSEEKRPSVEQLWRILDQD